MGPLAVLKTTQVGCLPKWSSIRCRLRFTAIRLLVEKAPLVYFTSTNIPENIRIRRLPPPSPRAKLSDPWLRIPSIESLWKAPLHPGLQPAAEYMPCLYYCTHQATERSLPRIVRSNLEFLRYINILTCIHTSPRIIGSSDISRGGYIY